MTETDLVPVRRALISVSDKAGVADFARGLADMGVELLSTGGTYRLLEENGIPVTEISAYTGFPEMMDGRVKTLHPKVHGGILARRGTDDGVMAEHGIEPIDMVVVNLYPFKETIAKPDVTVEQARGNIDIGGPCMIRASAKNLIRVASVVDPNDYGHILEGLAAHNGCTSLNMRYRLACKAVAHTASYDSTIAAYLADQGEEQIKSCYTMSQT